MPHCQYGECHSNSKRPEDGVTFLPFPKPWIDLKRAERWAFLCGRGADFTSGSIDRNSYICSKHFDGNQNFDWKKNATLEPLSARTSKKPTKRRVLLRTTETEKDTTLNFSPVFKPGENMKTFVRKKSKITENLVPGSNQNTSLKNIPSEPAEINLCREHEDSLQVSFEQSEVDDIEDATSFHDEKTKENEEKKSKDQGVQVEADFRPEVACLKSKIKALSVQLSKAKNSKLVQFCDDLFSDERKFQFYTGSTLEEFEVSYVLEKLIVNYLSFFKKNIFYSKQKKINNNF